MSLIVFLSHPKQDSPLLRWIRLMIQYGTWQLDWQQTRVDKVRVPCKMKPSTADKKWQINNKNSWNLFERGKFSRLRYFMKFGFPKKYLLLFCFEWNHFFHKWYRLTQQTILTPNINLWQIYISYMDMKKRHH